MSRPDRTSRLPAALRAAGVAATLLVAGVAGWQVAGPPGPPVALDPPGCPAVLGEALPAVGPSSTYFVPWGPVTSRVCRYDTAGRATPETAPLAGSTPLDATATAELAGLFHPLPDAPERCRAGAAPAPGADVAVVRLRYRPGATPTVGDLLTVVVAASGSCRTATNATQTRAVPDAAARRMADLVPALGPVLGVG